jgi:DNA-binding transcriptional LysR family regulator
MDEADSLIERPGRLPLAALRAFDAAVRTGGFKTAADDLGLTASAISHQIRALERLAGVRLFHRQGRAVVLSEAGARLAGQVRQGFAALARGLAEARAGERARRIHVSALALFSQTVLIPNLAAFHARWPQYEVRIVTTPAFADFDRDDVDVAIRVGTGRWPGLTSSELLRIRGAPVASPGYLATSLIATPADLAGARLIHDAALPDGWRRWLAAQGVSRENAASDLWFDTAPATLHAAEQGLGVALAIDPLVRSWPGYGVALAPVFASLEVPHTRYWLAHRRDADADPKIRAFVSWVRAACRRLDAA